MPWQSHFLTSCTSPPFAWNEGWAEFYESAVYEWKYKEFNNGRTGGTLRYAESYYPPFYKPFCQYGDCADIYWPGIYVEGAVMQTLWDLYDDENTDDEDPGWDDEGCGPWIGRIWNVIKTSHPLSMSWFLGKWWSMYGENSINEMAYCNLRGKKPPAPTGLSISFNPSNQQIHLNWEDNAELEGQYFLQRIGSERIIRLSSNTTEYVEYAEKLYNYKVACLTCDTSEWFYSHYFIDYSGFESDDPPPYEDTPWNSLSQPICGVRDITAKVVQESDEGVSTPYGEYMYKLKGYDESSDCGSCNMKLYDTEIPITTNTYLSCKFYIKESPEDAGHISLDGICSPWARLRDYFDPAYGKVVDQYGNTIRASGRSVPEGEWVEYVFNLSPLHGRILENLAIAYDDKKTSEQGWFTAYIDELKITEGYPNKYEWYVEVFGGDENAEVTWESLYGSSYGEVEFILDNNGGDDNSWLSVWSRIRAELEPIPIDENTIISWKQYDKNEIEDENDALVIGVLIRDASEEKGRWLYYARNAPDSFSLPGWVDMGVTGRCYNRWESFTRNIYLDYINEYGTEPYQALAVRVGNFARKNWDEDNGGKVIAPYIGPDTPSPSDEDKLEVLKPNGGEKWMVNTYRAIRWKYTGSSAKRFFIQYCTDYDEENPPPGGPTWKPIGWRDYEEEKEEYSYLWKVPYDPSTKCRVRVIALDEAQPIADISDNNFTIYGWDIHPDDDTKVQATPPGGDVPIGWYAQGIYGVSCVDVFLSGDNGASYELMAEGLSPGEEVPVDTVIVEQDTFYYYAYHGTYTLTLPETPTSAARIKLVAHDTAGNSWDWVSEPFPITFAEGEKLSTSYTASKIVYDGSNTHVVYKKDGEIKYSSTTDGYTWQEPEVISSAKDASIGYGSFPYILYVSSDRKTLYYSVKQGSWSPVPLVSYFEDIIGEPSQVMYDDTVYVVFFTNKEEEMGGGITYTQASLNLLRFAVDNPSEHTISTLWQYSGAFSLPLISAPSLAMDREKVLHVAFSHSGNTYIIKYENGTSSIQTIENASSPSLYVTNGNIYLLCKNDGVWIKKTGYVGDEGWIDEDTVSTSLSTAEIVDAGCIIGKEDSVALYLFDFVSSSYEREVIGGDGYYPHGILSDDRRFIWSENIEGSYYVVTKTEDVKNAVPEYYIVSGSVYRVYGEDGTYNGKDIDTGDSVGYYIPLISSDKSYKLMLEIAGMDSTGKVVLSINGTEDTVEVSDDFGVYVFELGSGESSVSISIKRMDVSFGVLRLVLYEGEIEEEEMIAYGYGGVQGEEGGLKYDFYPLLNPVFTDVGIVYSLPKACVVNILVYDASGRLVRRIEQRERSPGIYRVVWDRKDEHGRRVSKGIYFIRFETEDYKKTQKIVIIK